MELSEEDVESVSEGGNGAQVQQSLERDQLLDDE
jgi:hypothetical protein